MPRNYVPVVGPTRRRQYTDQQMRDAMQAVQDGMSQHKASETYGVPRITLRDRLANIHPRSLGGQTVLTVDEERVIAENVATLADWAFPLDLNEVQYLVKQYLDTRGRTSRFINNLPGVDWCKLFMKRHKSIISERRCQNISRKRHEVTAEEVGKYFDNLHDSLENVPACNILNYDETALVDDVGRKKFVFRRGCKYPERVANTTKTAISVMFAGTATGKLLDPYVVYKSSNLHDRWMEGGLPKVRYNRSLSGWFDKTTFSDWFLTTVVPYFRRLDPDNSTKKLVIGDNLSSHFTEDVLQKCEEHNIRFVCLPSNCTHLLQPLDVAVYAPLKKFWRQTLQNWKKTKEGNRFDTLPKEVFPSLLKEFMGLLQPTISANIISGFKKCGISPFDKESLLNRIRRVRGTTGEDDEEDAGIGVAVSQLVLDKLSELQSGGEKPKLKRKKKINVSPGKSICLADLANEQQSSSRETNAESYSAPDDSANEESSCDDESDGEPEGEHTGTEDEGEPTENGGIQIGDFLLVQFIPENMTGATTNQPYHYVGCVEGKGSDGEWSVSFLRRYGLSNLFTYPYVKDVLDILEDDVVRKCLKPKLNRGKYSFANIVCREFNGNIR